MESGGLRQLFLFDFNLLFSFNILSLRYINQKFVLKNMAEKKHPRKKKVELPSGPEAFKKMIDIYPPAFFPPEEEPEDEVEEKQKWEDEQEVSISQKTISYRDVSEDQEIEAQAYDIEETESQTQIKQIKDVEPERYTKYQPFKFNKNKTKKESYKPERKINYIFIFLATLMIGAILWYVGFKIMPKATVTIQTKKDIITFDSLVLMDTSVSKPDAERKVLPAQLLVFKESQSGEFAATGKSQNGAKAKGTITIYNNYNALPQILVATTRFISEKGLVFRLDSRTIVPGAITKDGKLEPSAIIATVTAEKAGAEYNIGASKFQIPGFQGSPKYEKFYAVSEKAFTGGGALESKYVTAEDLKNAEKVLGDKLFTLFDNDQTTKIPQGFKLLDSAKIVKIDNIQIDAKAGDTKDKFNVTLGGQTKVIVFSEAALITIIKETLKPTLIAGTNFYQEPEINYQNIKADFDKGTISVKILADFRTHYEIDDTEFKKELNNKSVPEAMKLIQSNSYIDKAQINLWPAWNSRIPQNTNRISIVVD